MLKNYFCLLLCLFVCPLYGQIEGVVQQKRASELGLQKLSPDLFEQVQQKKIDKKAILSLLISVNDLIKLKQQYAGDHSFKMESQNALFGAVQVKANTDWLRKALLDSNIQFIANVRKPFTERELTGFDLSVNKVNLAHAGWPTINGKGATVSIKEELMDTLDIDFKGRYLTSSLASTNLQTHATTMATIAAGGGNTFYTGKGVAWGASIANSDFINLLPDNTNLLKQLKVAVQNHSYGVGIENYYGVDAQAYDAQMNQDTTLLHVFSAGNFGNQTSTAGLYNGIAGFANLTGSFKMAKNILTVGATDLFNHTTSISSRGPAYDGRVKPELVALGEDGSSGAAAIVSGISMLVREALVKKYGNTKPPSSSLIKAILLNSADDIGAPNIDYTSGYGAANAWRALQTVEEGKIIQGTIGLNQVNTYNIIVPNNVNKLKITISWIDPAATANNTTALVNDLDFELTQIANSNKYLPWVLNSSPNLSALQSPATRGRDSLNNTEQITVDQPATGNYQLVVRGSKLTGLEQAYSIAWQYDTISHFQFTFPVKGNQLIPNTINTIRWETNIPSTANLQYRIDGGTWETIANNINLTNNYYEWNCPNQLGALQLRMIAGSINKQTDSIALAPIISAKIGFNCADSFLLYWPKIGVNQYQVSQLGNQYLEPFLISADTILIKEKLNNPFQVYTVAPILPNNIKGLPGYAINYTQQQIACYINGFFADPSGTSNANLTLQLGTTFQVDKIIFEKLFANGFKPIRTISPVTTAQISSIETASPGLNTYRAKVELLNGQSYYTSPAQVLNFTEKPYYLFPNPVVSGGQLKLMSSEVDSTVLQLFDISGKKVHTQFISSFIETIQLPILPRGVYYAIINRAGIIQKRIPILIL
ncbi:S8 family serine peptidase [Sediminibacterium sp.]|uniref:S8 family serine peptidase n=1 Tax=Sediminibacterium sp. TaxID=1917865 RepID=UPI002734E4F1|nr:S8 family serine peptidase [Sediminibacterium sp.]MDP3392988.1 S8 family serine peptidase [Sediminibacterium sp.]MDP3567194.1 S8 family serine peptidase [Sediminibacterium sp.]